MRTIYCSLNKMNKLYKEGWKICVKKDGKFTNFECGIVNLNKQTEVIYKCSVPSRLENMTQVFGNI